MGFYNMTAFHLITIFHIITVQNVYWSLSSRVGHESVNFSVVKAFGKVG